MARHTSVVHVCFVTWIECGVMFMASASAKIREKMLVFGLCGESVKCRVRKDVRKCCDIGCMKSHIWMSILLASWSKV